ncbi:MAG: hypothetical protein N3D14_03120 [Aquificaceae bacterium]|nr:hypothetical protein [Aquificaceae bacterium]
MVSGFFITACLLWLLGSFVIPFALLKNIWSLPLLVHVNTVGLALFTMMGALFQMLPVVAGAVIENPKRKALISWSLLFGGYLPFLSGFFIKSLHLLLIGGFFLLTGVLYTSLLMLHRLISIKSYTPTSKGMKFALLYLILGAIVGFALLLSYWGFLPYRAVLLKVHLASMLFGWVFLLVASVSFQVVEMFFVTKPYARNYAMNFPYFLTAALFLSLWDSLYSRVPLALLVLFHAFLTLRRLMGRKRKTTDKLLHFWYLAFLNLTVSVPFYLLKDVDEVFFHYFLISFGLFFTTLIIGMMLRIVSFLVWFHLSNEGAERVPLMSEVINQRMVSLCLYLTALLSVSLYSLYFTKLYILPLSLYLMSAFTFSFCIIRGCMVYFRESPLYNPSV